MKQDWLNICLLVYCHKTLADATDPVAITKTFASANNKSLFKTRNKVRGRLNWDISFFLSALIPPPPSGRLSYVVFVVGSTESYIRRVQMRG